jgi:FdhD protein
MIINDQSDVIDAAVSAEAVFYNADGSTGRAASQIVREHFMDLVIQEELAAKLVCTPSCLTELAVGRMLTEGIISDISEIESIYICNAGSKAKVFLTHPIILKSFVEQEPTCCTGNRMLLRAESEKLQKLAKAEWKPEWIFALADEFASGSKIHRATSGTHSCYLGIEGQVVYSVEDIGRHNAMDKAIGYAALNGMERSKCILYTTGRVPTDMIKKAVAARIPVLVSKAVPTDEAVQMAAYYNLTLICKAWPDRFEVFHMAK